MGVGGQERLPEGLGPLAPAGSLRGLRLGHRVRGLHQQRGVEQLDHLQVRLEADDRGEAERFVPHRAAVVRAGHGVEQDRLGLFVRRFDTDPAGAGRVRRGRLGGEQRLVDAVSRHQLLRLGAERLRLLRIPGGLGLGEQGTDAGEHAGGGRAGGAAGLLLQGLQGGQAQQQAVQLQGGRGLCEAVGLAGGVLGQLPQLGGPAPPARTVLSGLGTDQCGGSAHMCVVQLAAHQSYDVGGLPAAPPGRRDELLAPPRQFGVRGWVGGEEGGAGVEAGVGVVVEGGPEGALDGAGSAGHTVDRAMPHRQRAECCPQAVDDGIPLRATTTRTSAQGNPTVN